MTSAEYRQLNQKPGKAASSAPGKGKTTKAPKAELTPHEKAKQAEARKQAVGYGRREDEITTFGVRQFILKYSVFTQAEADQLNAVFESFAQPKP